MHRKPRVEVVIPTHDRRDLVQSCLSALARQTYRDFRSVVVDDGSGDGTADAVRREFPDTRVVALPRNRGFAAAVNAGIRTSPSELVAILNNDAEAEPGWLGSLVRALDRLPDVDGAASLVLRADEPLTIDAAGDGMSGLFIPYPVGSNERDDGRFDRERSVLAVSGCAALFRRDLFDAIGFFDESFFAYFEDADFSLRAILDGRRFVFVPEGRVRHVGAASTGGRFSPASVRLSTRNLLFTLAKNLPTPLLVRSIPRIAAGQAWWFLKMAVKERHPLAWLAGAAAGVAGFAARRREGHAARAAARIPWTDFSLALRRSADEVAASIRRKREDRRRAARAGSEAPSCEEARA